MMNTQEIPYIGLRPYTYEDRDKFFGRDEEKQILFDKILANKLTLLFAASGVGKSSLLRAGVIPELFKHNYDVVYFFEWADQPELNLKQAILKVLKDQQRISDDYQVNLELPLAKFIKVYQLLCEERLIIILDQFEEFFNYARLKDSFKPFIESLSEAMQAHDTTTIFVLSMREDFALELNAFKTYVAGIFDNFYRLEKLTKQAAQQAILKPLEKVGFKFEENLFEQLLDDLSRREQIDRYGLEQALQLKEVILFVEPPHLQIVCSQLWELECNQSDKTIHFKIYEKQGKAQGFLKNHFISKISQLNSSEQKLASAAFDFLVNKHGTKMAYPLNDLAKLLRKDEKVLGQTLNRLEQARILRKTERHGHHDQPILWFELYHDVFANSAYQWNEQFKSKQRRQKLIKIASVTIGSLSAIGIGIDYGLNANFQYLQANTKTNRIELYQGYLNSIDIFRQQRFLAEMPFEREQLEADKRFEKQQLDHGADIFNYLADKLPLEKRIKAYVDMGEFEKITDTELAKPILQNNESSAPKVIGYLVSSRSNKGLSLLEYIIKKQNTAPSIKKAFIDKISYFTHAKNFVPLLITLLNDNDADIPYSATNILVKLQAKEAIPQLINLFNKKHGYARSHVAKALGRLQVKEAIPQIIELFKDKTARANYDMSNVLVKMQIKEVIPPLIELLKDNNTEVVRESAIWALRQLQAKEAIPQLIELLKDNNVKIRSYAIYALGELQGKEFIPQLTKLLKDSDSEVRSSAINTLVKLQVKEFIPQLIELLKDNQFRVRYSAINTLVELHVKEAVPQIIELLKDEINEIRSNAMNALVKLQAKEAIPQLIELLKGDLLKDSSEELYEFKNQREITRVINTLVKLQAKEAIPQFIELFKDKDDEIRSNAILALRQLQAKEVIPQLMGLLKDNNPIVRSSAIVALRQLQAKEAIPQLIDLLNDKSVRSNAINALGQLQAKEAIPQLIDLLKDNDADADVRAKVIGMLGRLQAKESIPLLFQSSNNYDIKIRESTINVLSNFKVTQVIPLALEYYRTKIRAFSPLETKNTKEEGNWQSIINHLGIKYLRFVEQSKLETIDSEIIPDFLCLKGQILNEESTNKTKISVLRMVGQLETQEAAQFIIEQFNEFRVFAIQALGDTKQLIALNFLKNQLKKLEESHFTKLEEQNYLETELAHSITKLEPSEGIKLLKHSFAEVRSGALIGISHYININTFKELLKTFQETTIPIHRFALYKTIDSSLLTFESTATQEDLNQLIEVKENLTQLINSKETTNQHTAIKDRLEWTINEINYRLKNPKEGDSFEETSLETSIDDDLFVKEK